MQSLTSVRHILLIFTALFLACKGETQSTNSPISQFKAIAETVFVDNAEQGEYALSISIKEGVLTKDDYVKAVGGKSNTYYFQVKEIKVADKVVASAKAGDNAFIVMITPFKASYFDTGFVLSASTKTAYLEQKTSLSTSSNNQSATSSSPKVEFMLNGKPVLTAPKGKDMDTQTAMLLNSNKQLTIILLGDHAEQPKRGMLTISVSNFQFKLGAVTNASFGFVRYKDAAGNTLGQWQTSMNTYGTLTITDIKPMAGGLFGQNYIISGTFEANLSVSLGYSKLVREQELKITKGAFINVIIERYGKEK